uniref:Probable secreted beta-glucosidase adg3 isoform X3 n=1 Tax=Crassostrea virginica TaxID=6565 RepID=A0A8B8DF33_CRAVI|nr:probable secreted beta-glucosidase adg3 isoform X3 [Crassostrea virginica]XP_022326304.1 probable secreted beta-glucosidase adg3 isoform X3 [Crassostrea virginica]XP_022326305.1 probable secreted beta-glucosidase adg3 isoform X3 [Crassostrea virginica]
MNQLWRFRPNLTFLWIYWIESGMESDVAPDEMYLMLQADMMSIKKQERALQSEIAEIQSKFFNLVENCGIQHNDFPVRENSSVVSPSFLHNATASSSFRRHVLPQEEDEEFLLQQLLQGSVCSSSSDSLYEDSEMTLIIDNNSNYKSSPFRRQPENTMVSLASMIVPNLTETLSSSDISNGSSRMTTSSDGYPRSTETSSDIDNQCVPCLDFEEELASRTKYYSDFTIDRQRKINNLSAPLSNGNESSKDSENSDNGVEELFTREVEGCEAKDLPAFRAAPLGVSTVNDSRVIAYSRTGSHSSATDNSSVSSRSGHRSSRSSRSSASSNRSSSSSSSRKSTTNPQASSTMIEDLSPLSSRSSGSSRHKSSTSNPQASSTMIEDLQSSKGSSRCSSHEDFVSVYTWSIHDTSEEVNLEDSYLRNVGHKVNPRSTRSSRSSSASSTASRKSTKRDRDSNRIQHVLTEPDSQLGNSLSVIEQASDIREAYLGADSLYEDDEIQYKASTLPRTSTRLYLVGQKSSASSSLEARRSSMPDILSVCTPSDFHSVPTSDDEEDNNSADDSSPLQERIEVPGKSSSSGCTSSPPGNSTKSDATAPNNTEALIDSILTDSPVSACSSGIAAPYNSYNSPADSHPASRTSQSTNSDNKSESSIGQPSGPPSSVASSPAAPAAKAPVSDFVFKKPLNTQPLRKLFKFKKSKGKSVEKIPSTSTPSHAYPSSVHSDPLSRRKLFSGSSQKMHDVQLMDKKAVMKKFRRFSESFHKRDGAGLPRIQTLANL